MSNTTPSSPSRTIRRHTWPSIPEAEEALVREAETLTGRTLPRGAVSHLVYDLAGKGHAIYSDALLTSVAELRPPAEEVAA